MHDTVENVFVVVMTMGGITVGNPCVENDGGEGQAICEELALDHCLGIPCQHWLKTDKQSFQSRNLRKSPAGRERQVTKFKKDE